MKNIFFKAVPGLFQRSKKVNGKNQEYYYDNKVQESIAKLENSNRELVTRLLHLNETTSTVGKRTMDLFHLIDDVKMDQAEEMEKLLEQMNEINDTQKIELEQLKGIFQNNYRKQDEKVSKQLGDLRTHLKQLKENQSQNQINQSNDHEAFIVLLEGLYKRLDSMQLEQQQEMEKIITEINVAKKELAEGDDIHLEYNKSNADILHKMREQHFEFENTQLVMQKQLSQLIKDIRKDVSNLEKLMEVNEESIKN